MSTSFPVTFMMRSIDVCLNKDIRDISSHDISIVAVNNNDSVRAVGLLASLDTASLGAAISACSRFDSAISLLHQEN